MREHSKLHREVGAAIVILAAATVFPCAAQAKYSWTISKEQSMNTMANVCGYESTDFGISAGVAGETHYTKDGGTTWPRSDSVDAACRFVLDIVDVTTAVSSGNDGTVVTKDGGKNWISISRLNFDSLSFLDGSTGWGMINRNRILTTADAGKTWKALTLPEKHGKVCAISLIAPDVGCFVDSVQGESATAQSKEATDGQ